MPDMSTNELLLYFKALGNILVRNNRCLTELYLIVKDYGLENRWNEIAQAFTDNDALSSHIQTFIDSIPYPSEKRISQQAMFLAMQTLFRTNYLEDKMISMLPVEVETLIRLFMVNEDNEKQFNEMISIASESKRKPDLQTSFELTERLPEDILFREQISIGIDKIIKDLEQANQNRKKSITESIKDTARTIPENTKRLMEGVRKKIKKESITLPPQYQKLKQKLPEDIGIPKNAVGYGMRTEAASCLLISCPVTEEASMPFDDPQSVIDELHRIMGDSEGVIEVKSGITSSGRSYTYEIIKHRFITEDGIPQGVEYTLNINIRMENTIQFIIGSFSEEGTTGLRDTICLELYARTKKTSYQEVMKDWFKDPYDPEYKKGFLMNLSERSEFDEKFPNHPLSQARALVDFLSKNN